VRSRIGAVTETRPLLVGGVPPARGLVLRGVRADHVQAWGLVRGLVEPSVQEAMRRHITKGAVVWDVGANLGFFSLVAARLGATVHAFEPVAQNAEKVRVNARVNGFEQAIEVHEVAVAAQAGRQPLLVVKDASWSHLADRGVHAQTADVVEVAVVSLDDLSTAPPTFLKIDVEGSELAVLQGAERLLRDSHPVLVIEVHVASADVCQFLQSLGYTVENLDGTEPPNADDGGHILARPSLPL
jgi:FkbM family methyltransferase